uniref:histidine--tRNA ligase n=1 Tax=Bangiopsis subsimplex TaxID=139980 RepID=A0A1C9CCU2_9RHOD|nr:histidine-tRNA synthetase [Bangiopsis subsimplex]AOM66177.1 histidine-tRNA synthetase [Bangiopsis subsimplex]
MQAIRGTKDILSSNIDSWQKIEQISQSLLELANYKEIRTPIFENSNLYNRSLGEITDIVQKEMYTFIDKSKREITLRPEGTAGIARAFIEHKLYTETLPQRYWYYGPMFRYERPQAGRQRQFHQLGIECIGSPDPLLDVEVISLAMEIFTQLHLSNLSLEINSLGNVEVRNAYQQALYSFLSPYKTQLDIESQNRLEKNPLRLLDSKDEFVQKLLLEAPTISKFLDVSSQEHLNKVCNYLDKLNIKYIVNPKLVRGLDYYNDTTFEIKASGLGSQDTICGGGRYNGLIKSLGGPSTPAVGWAIGLERLVLIISEALSFNSSLDCYFIILRDAAKEFSLPIIYELRKHKVQVEMVIANTNLQKYIKKAVQLKATTCIIVGDEEVENNKIQLKILHSRKQEFLSVENIAEIVTKIKFNSSISVATKNIKQ